MLNNNNNNKKSNVKNNTLGYSTLVFRLALAYMFISVIQCKYKCSYKYNKYSVRAYTHTIMATNDNSLQK